MDKYISFGKVHSTHGLKGEVCLECFFENYEFFSKKDCFYMENDGVMEPIKLTLTGTKKGNLMISIDGCKQKEEACLLLQKEIFILRSAMEGLPQNPEGEHYVCDIIGLEATVDGQKYGMVEDVVDYGGGPLLEVKLDTMHPKNVDKKEEVEYFEKKSIKEVDLSKGLVLITTE